MQQPTLNSDGFSASQIVNPDTRRTPPQEMVGGVPYFLYVFPVAITATKTGRLSLGPASWELNVFTGPPDIFGRRRQQHITVMSDPIPVTVLPVPSSPDAIAFSGAVGDFALAQFDANPTTLAVGDPITLKIRIIGHGGFDNLVLPTNQPAGATSKPTNPPPSSTHPTRCKSKAPIF